MLFTRAFWKDNFERMVFTFAESVVGLAGAETMGLLTADWPNIILASAIIGILAGFKGIAALGKNGTAGFGVYDSTAYDASVKG